MVLLIFVRSMSTWFAGALPLANEDAVAINMQRNIAMNSLNKLYSSITDGVYRIANNERANIHRDDGGASRGAC